MNNYRTKEKRIITKVVTIRLLGIKILSLTTEIPEEMSSRNLSNYSKSIEEIDFARNGTEEASLQFDTYLVGKLLY